MKRAMSILHPHPKLTKYMSEKKEDTKPTAPIATGLDKAWQDRVVNHIAQMAATQRPGFLKSALADSSLTEAQKGFIEKHVRSAK